MVLILVYLVVAGASHLWPFQTSGQSQASVRQSAQTLLRLLPHDAENCGRVPASDGLGSVLAVTCASPSLTGSVYGYLYENENDEKAGFAAFNHRSGVDVSKLGNACPPANGSGGTIPWRNNGQRTEPDQKLECYTGGSDTPIYVWTIPSDHAFIVALGSKGESFQTLETWWEHNA